MAAGFSWLSWNNLGRGRQEATGSRRQAEWQQTGGNRQQAGGRRPQTIGSRQEANILRLFAEIAGREAQRHQPLAVFKDING
jgi:hypothetical protein